jgi:Sec-independent protein translocase protein TatA
MQVGNSIRNLKKATTTTKTYQSKENKTKNQKKRSKSDLK